MIEKPITLEESQEIAERSDVLDGAVFTAEDMENRRESEAEREAEGAWLRKAESASWEEDYLESLRESGLIQ